MADLLGFDYTTGTIRWQAIAGQNEIETVVQSGGATGGTFTLNYEHPAVTVGPINSNDNIAAIQAAYTAAFGASNTLVSGTDATSFTVEFLVTYALTGIDFASLTNSLTGGDSPTVTVTSTQRGQPNQTTPLLDLQDEDGNSVLSVLSNRRIDIFNPNSNADVFLGAEDDQGRISVHAVNGQTGDVLRVFAGDGTKVIGATGDNKLGFLGATPVAQQSTPVTLGDVIALLQVFGLSA